MLICPNCLYQNPNGVGLCEACCSELSDDISCPTCGEPALTDATFCGICGYLFHPTPPETPGNQNISSKPLDVNHRTSFSPSFNLLTQHQDLGGNTIALKSSKPPVINISTEPFADTKLQGKATVETLVASLLHLQSDVRINLNTEKPVIHIGKPNNEITPDIDVAFFSNAAVVSRIHADIWIENNHFFIEDRGSANGTFLNQVRIYPGEKSPLTPGDTISLGKGNLVSFIFELS